MHSGNGRNNGGFVSQIEAQLVFLSAILETYVSKGYVVLELPPSKVISHLLNGDHIGWLRVRGQEVDLETRLETLPQATVLKPCTEYIALPQNWNGHGASDKNSNSMLIQYCTVNHGTVKFSARNFVVSGEGVLVLDAETRPPRIPVELTFFDFYNALERLKPAVQQAVRVKRRG